MKVVLNDIKALSSQYISPLIKNKITFEFPLSVTEKDHIIFIDTTNFRKILHPILFKKSLHILPKGGN